jgi:flagellar biosynthesis protein FlhF
VVLFAGPAGAGKTTSLIKLALRYGLRAGVPVQILSLDTLRVGGWEQLASYARITGLAFDVIHHLSAFGQALAECRNKKLILIDTPGFSPAELQETPELATWLARETAVEVQLVLPAVLRPRVAQRAVERFAAFRPSKLLFTHFDEVEAPGGVLEVAIRSGLPISYLADGQQIPEDIHQASKARLLEHFTAVSRQAAASAA